MRTYCLLIFAALIYCNARAQTELRLATKIDSLFAKDQSVQQLLMAALQNKVPVDSFMKLQAIQMETFKRHIAVIKDIFATHGYPKATMVGKEASQHFFVLVQHADADPSFQSAVLPVIKELASSNEVSKKEYAFLYDRVQVNNGRKQLYGTQVTYDKNGNLFDSSNRMIIPINLEDPEHVDKRRKEMGMEPLEEYYELVLRTVGRPRKKN
jgi:hypothetical protein